MNNRAVLNLVGILAVYLLYAAIVMTVPYSHSAFGPVLPLRNQGDFMTHFQNGSLVVVGVSLVCMMAWYVLGEWGLKPWTSSGTWYAVWLGLLVVIFGVALVVAYTWMGTKPPRMNSTVAPYFLLGGILSYYIASVFFSPTPAKNLIWPAKLVRSW